MWNRFDRLRECEQRLDRLERVSLAGALERVERLLHHLTKQEEQAMTLGEDILAKVTEADGKVDSVIVLINELRGTVIPQDVADRILAKIQGSEDKLDAAIGPAGGPAPPA